MKWINCNTQLPPITTNNIILKIIYQDNIIACAAKDMSELCNILLGYKDKEYECYWLNENEDSELIKYLDNALYTAICCITGASPIPKEIDLSNIEKLKNK